MDLVVSFQPAQYGRVCGAVCSAVVHFVVNSQISRCDRHYIAVMHEHVPHIVPDVFASEGNFL